MGRVIDRARRLATHARAPYVLLAVLCLVSLGSRVYRLDDPCPSSCAQPAKASLIFDEAYYVNAARVIAGIDPPEGQPFHGAPLHQDPNAEHPQLAKLVMAGGIKVFGDDPLGWRLGSLLFGTTALLLFFALVRSAGGSPWLALGATAVMSLDNLDWVHGRIATLDVYALAFVLGAGVAYLRGKPLVAGLVLGLGMCAKLVSAYVLFAFGLLELLRWVRRRARPSGDAAAPTKDPVVALAICIAAAGIAYVGVLSAMDAVAPPYDAGQQQAVTGGPIAHTRHMLDTATALKNPAGGPQGAASYPWTWVTGGGQFDYLRVANNETTSDGTVVATHDLVRFHGAVNPFLILLTIPALFAAAAAWWRRGEEVDLLVVAWFAGTFLPFCAQSLFESRIMYIHYVLLVLPAISLGAARLFSRVPRPATVGWAVALVVGVVQLFPFRTLG